MILVLLVIIGFRLPYYISGIDMIIPELKWMLIGERLNSGFGLYTGVVDDIGPFSAWTYQLLDFIFGRSVTAYRFLATALVFIQCYIFNSFLLANKSYRENTYVPAFMFAVFMCYSFDFFTLSPQLISLTFVLLALNNIFKRIDNKTRDELFLYTGIHLAVAVLFYFPAWILFVTFLLILIVFSNSLPRRLLLMVFGFFTTFGIIALVFFIKGSFYEFIIQFVISHWSVDQVFYVSSSQILYLAIVPSIFTLLAFVKIYGSTKFVNFQLKFQQAMLFLLVGVSFLFLNANEVCSQIILFAVPSLAFFAAHFLLLIKRALWLHIATVSILAVIFFSGYLPFNENKLAGKLVSYDQYFVPDKSPAILKDRKLLVLGNDITLYKEAIPTMSFLNWSISKKRFNEVDYYDNAVKILKDFQGDPPELIVDMENVLPQVFERIPVMSSKYSEVPGYPGYYIYSSN